MSVTNDVEIEYELRSMGSDQLRRERMVIEEDLKSLQNQIGDLAFNNYRTYADAGRTTQHCTEIFTEMSEKLREISGDVSSLSEELRSFHSHSSNMTSEFDLIHSASDKGSPLWEVLSLPSRMDLCIRAGYYEAAYSLTNYGITLQQHSIIKNPLIKNIADRLVEARSFLLDELFNKFSGPLDLAASIQVVNNVRKMPYLTSSQLRISVLQHRDIYLDKQILDIVSHPEYPIRAIEIYRDCMYDTLVLYLAVFPENEINRKDPLIDPRWESWPMSPPSTLLGQWALRNISRLLELVQKADVKSGVDMCVVWSKMMSLASSFGRMGLDFRPFILSSLTSMVVDRFRISVRQVTNRLINEVKVLSIATGEISSLPSSKSILSDDTTPIPSLEISMWDDICVYGNGIIEALNNMRYSLSPVLINSVVQCVRDSIRAVLSWLSTHHQSVQFPRAVKVICLHLTPLLTQCIRFLFPFCTITRLFASTITRQQYESYTELNISDLANICDGSERIEEVLLPLLQKKRFADIDLETVLRKEELEEQTVVYREGEPKEPAVFQYEEEVNKEAIDEQKDLFTLIQAEENTDESTFVSETKHINGVKHDNAINNMTVIAPSNNETSSLVVHLASIENNDPPLNDATK